MHVPVYGDLSNDECLIILGKEFNLLIEDGDLMKEEMIGTEDIVATWETPNKDEEQVDRNQGSKLQV